MLAAVVLGGARLGGGKGTCSACVLGRASDLDHPQNGLT